MVNKAQKFRYGSSIKCSDRKKDRKSPKKYRSNEIINILQQIMI